MSKLSLQIKPLFLQSYYLFDLVLFCYFISYNCIILFYFLKLLFFTYYLEYKYVQYVQVLILDFDSWCVCAGTW